MILVDLNYREGNRGRLYTDVLQDPLGATPKLPGQDTPQGHKLQTGLVEAQERLRRAVAESRGLQAEADRRGEKWLRRYVAVHLNVMNPADFSYRTSRLIGHFPIAPDNVVRDHRKVAFRDVTETDPARGEALYGGVGVGEQYTTATWEDRAVRLTGPAALTVKEAARRYLEANGVEEERMPPPLRPRPKPADYDDRVRALEAAGRTARAVEVHNERGFARKDASIASAVLYTLMPPGSLIVVPDSIWTHELWAAHLVAAALRGCHVYVIAPAAANAPSAGFPQLSRTREIFRRFFEIQGILGPQIEARGGRLRTGLYTRKAGVDDLRARFAEMHETFTRYPFLKEDFPFPPEFYEGFARADERLAAAGYRPDESLPEDAVARAPKLHRKTQLFVTREALETLVRDPRVQGVIADQMRFAVRHGVTLDAEGLADPKADLAPLFVPLLEAWRGRPGGYAERPASTRATISAVPLTPRAFIARARCISTVLTLRESRPAISRLDSPSVTASATSRSRGVSAATRLAASSRAGPSLRRRASISMARRTISRSASARKGFSTKSMAPARTARSAIGMSPWPLRKTTG
jgi:hypothetical protein